MRLWLDRERLTYMQMKQRHNAVFSGARVEVGWNTFMYSELQEKQLKPPSTISLKSLWTTSGHSHVFFLPSKFTHLTRALSFVPLNVMSPEWTARKIVVTSARRPRSPVSLFSQFWVPHPMARGRVPRRTPRESCGGGARCRCPPRRTAAGKTRHIASVLNPGTATHAISTNPLNFQLKVSKCNSA